MNYRKRDERMVVAFHHLCPLSKSLIRRKVNSILKVYGDEGWVFLAEDFKLLIEVILEQHEEPYLNNGSMEIDAASTSNQQLKQVVEIEHTCIEPELERRSQPNKEPGLSFMEICLSTTSSLQKRIDAYHSFLISFNQSLRKLLLILQKSLEDRDGTIVNVA